MDPHDEIARYIASQPEPRRGDLQTLHDLLLGLMPGCRLWFLDGKDADGRTVSNPNIGYGTQVMTYADGTTREFYRIGTSANTTGISVYIMGLKDRKFLAETYGKTIGKASVSGYCIKFRTLGKVDVGVLVEAMRHATG
jgi:hypothetical protein